MTNQQPRTTDLAPFTQEMANRAVTFKPLGESTEITLTVAQVYQVMAKPTARGVKPPLSEIVTFMELCAARQVNPWVGDAYLVGFDTKDGPQFSLITSVHVLHKRAELSDQYDGMSAGVIVKDADGNIVDRTGAFRLDGDTLLGGWAICERKDTKIPFVSRLRLQAYDQNRSRWKSDKEGMILKCAKANVLREAFPNTCNGLYVGEEFGDEGVIDAAEFSQVSAREPMSPDPPPAIPESKSDAIVESLKSQNAEEQPEPDSPEPVQHSYRKWMQLIKPEDADLEGLDQQILNDDGLDDQERSSLRTMIAKRLTPAD